ncbi:MAG: hypothetical protein ACOZFS_05250 [Thermodesulfobacteriota bacterium]
MEQVAKAFLHKAALLSTNAKQGNPPDKFSALLLFGWGFANG